MAWLRSRADALAALAVGGAFTRVAVRKKPAGVRSHVAVGQQHARGKHSQTPIPPAPQHEPHQAAPHTNV
jgi:hypothetical protein